jgi:prolyl-tRNA editing enzyme YbaK/EbsC (Cys-tRNA(Pro) deacylase)
MTAVLGKLVTEVALERPDLLATPVRSALESWDQDLPVSSVLVAPIDPELADTAAFCEAYDVGLHESANCVIISGKRGGESKYAACLVLATTRADVNTTARKLLDVRKASFAPMAEAVELTGMEYGGITPIGLPPQWPVYVDSAVVSAPAVVIGSGIRASKIVIPGQALAGLPTATVVTGLGIPV